MLFRSAYAALTRRGSAKTTIATPWTALPTLAAKLRQLGVSAIVVAPYSPNKMSYQYLHRLASHTMHFPPARDLFFPSRLGKPAGVGPPAMSIVVFRVQPLHGSTLDAAR